MTNKLLNGLKKIFTNTRLVSQKDKSGRIYPSSITRMAAGLIDWSLLMIVRTFAALILATIWLKPASQRFIADFSQKFGNADSINKATASTVLTDDQLAFFLHHSFIYQMIGFYFIIIFVIGMLYSGICSSSRYRATIGQKIFRLELISTKTWDGLSFIAASLRYLVMTVPMIVLIYFIAGAAILQTSPLHFVVDHVTNIIVAIGLVIWTQAYFATRGKSAAHDLLCHSVIIKQPKT